jgi:hypothetical protein
VTPEDAALASRYAWLDALPPALAHFTVSHRHGTLHARGECLASIRRDLLAGRAPDVRHMAWPEERDLREAMTSMFDEAVVEECAFDARRTDKLLLVLLRTIEEADDALVRGNVALQVLERDAQRGLGQTWSEDPQADARRIACELVRTRARRVCRGARARRGLHGLFGCLACAAGLDGGIGHSMAKSLGLEDAEAIQSLTEDVPEITELIRSLGRMLRKDEDDDATPPLLEDVATTVSRIVHAESEVLGGTGGEVRGVERSSELARMLPSESALLTRPALRRLWRARWAERALLTYHAPGVVTERIRTMQTFDDGETTRNQRAERGPVLICLDTSGSMRGRPGQLAKAVVLQVVSTAFMEKRPCYLYNFSGPGDVAEEQLSLEGEGLTKLISFLAGSWDGGTDVDVPLERAMKRLDEEGTWRQADLLLVSDGYFHASGSVLRELAALRARRNALVHGVRVGDGDGFLRLRCDRVIGVSGLSPVSPYG